jgi:hypothetical protein
VRVTSDMGGTYRAGPQYPPAVLMGAAPTWISENLTEICLVGLALVTIAVARLVQKATVRITLLALTAGLALFIFVNRHPLEACARTCACQVAGQDVDVPFCDPDLDLSPSRRR